MKKLTIEDLEALVESSTYYCADVHTTCVIKLKCGYRLIGESACLNPADYDEALGKKVAYNQALDKLWALDGYHKLRSKE